MNLKNEANCDRGEMDVNIFERKRYGNVHLRRRRKNEANCTRRDPPVSAKVTGKGCGSGPNLPVSAPLGPVPTSIGRICPALPDQINGRDRRSVSLLAGTPPANLLKSSRTLPILITGCKGLGMLLPGPVV
jgi:hypothetical protein